MSFADFIVAGALGFVGMLVGVLVGMMIANVRYGVARTLIDDTKDEANSARSRANMANERCTELEGRFVQLLDHFDLEMHRPSRQPVIRPKKASREAEGDEGGAS